MASRSILASLVVVVTKWRDRGRPNFFPSKMILKDRAVIAIIYNLTAVKQPQIFLSNNAKLIICL